MDTKEYPPPRRTALLGIRCIHDNFKFILPYMTPSSMSTMTLMVFLNPSVGLELTQ